MLFWKILLKLKPDGGDGAGGGTPPEPAKDDGKGKEKKSVADEMKALQAAHDEEMKKLKKELDEEKAQHAKDLREKLLHGGGDDNNEKTAAQKIYETMKKKYGN